MSSQAISELQKLRQQPSRQSLAAVRRLSQIFTSQSLPVATNTSHSLPAMSSGGDMTSRSTTESADSLPSFTFPTHEQTQLHVPENKNKLNQLRAVYLLLADLLTEQIELRSLLATRSPSCAVDSASRLSGALAELEATVNKLVSTRSELEVMTKKYSEMREKYEQLSSQYRDLKSDHDALLTSKKNLESDSPLPPSSPPPPDEPAIVVDIDLGGSSSSVRVTPSTNPYETAFTFLSSHNLPPHYLEPLVEYLKETKASLQQPSTSSSAASASPPDLTISPSASSGTTPAPESVQPSSQPPATTNSTASSTEPSLSVAHLRQLVREKGISDISDLLSMLSQNGASLVAHSSSSPSPSISVTAVSVSTTNTSTSSTASASSALPVSPIASVTSSVLSTTASSSPCRDSSYFISSGSSHHSSSRSLTASPLSINIRTNASASSKPTIAAQLFGQLSLHPPQLADDSYSDEWSPVDCYLDPKNKTLTCCINQNNSYAIVGVVSLQDTLAAPISQGLPYSFTLTSHSSSNGVPSILEGFTDFRSGDGSRSIVLRSETLPEMVRWINNINSVSSNVNGDTNPSISQQQQKNISSEERGHLSFSANDCSFATATRSADDGSTSNTRSSSPNKTLTLDELSPNATPTTPISLAQAATTPLSRDTSQRSLLSSLSSTSTPRQQHLQQTMAALPNPSPIELAVEIYDSATTLANAGDVDDAIPLFLHALKTFEEYQLPELAVVREEVWTWIESLPQYKGLLDSEIERRSRNNRDVDLL